MDEQEIKDRLIAQNEEFRAIYEEHQTCEQELDGFQNKSYLTDEDNLKVKELKRRKLTLKDKMYRMMDQFRKSPS
jgi:uncharacterized protein YdcH (DUF465 family)